MARKSETLASVLLESIQAESERCTVIGTILLVFAFVIFCIAAWWNPAPPYRGNLIAAGLAFWVLSILLGFMQLHLR